MKPYIAAYMIALLAELGASWWHWQRASYDNGLHRLYGYSFVNYELERLIPWLCLMVIFSVVRTAVYLITVFTKRDPEQSIGRRNW